LRESLRLHRLSFLVYIAFLWTAFYHVACLCCSTWEGRPIICTIQHYLPWVIIGALLLNWVLGFWLGSNGS
jgi:hypothetical protein